MIKFRVLNTVTNKIVRDGRLYSAYVDHLDGAGTLKLNSLDLRPLLFTGFFTSAGEEVFDGDIVEGLVTSNRGQESLTDQVQLVGGAWRFGTFDGTLADVVLIKIRGNIYETPWPKVTA